MQSGVWERLALPFAQDALEWRVLEVKAAEDAQEPVQARVRPQLRFERVVARLDEALTVGGWSNRYVALGADLLACELTLENVTKSGVAGSVAVNPAQVMPTDMRARDALVYAAELFGLAPPADPNLVYWVDYDPEAAAPLFEPEPGVPSPAGETPFGPDSMPESSTSPVSTPSAPTLPAPTPPAPKPAGQQAIDRLVERLRGEGKGLEVAKLVTRYGGYGDDPEAAKELYSKLRELLLEDSALPS